MASANGQIGRYFQFKAQIAARGLRRRRIRGMMAYGMRGRAAAERTGREGSCRTNVSRARASATRGYSYTLSLISGKHKPVILYCLMEYEPVRFNEMRRYLGNIADKTLSLNLKELERDGLIQRKMYPEVPPKVEYSLSERGASLVKILDKLCEWGLENRP